MTANLLLAMAIGVVGTSVIHLSKGVMKRGLSRLQAKDEDGRMRARAIYGLGIAMNFTNPLWVIIANRFAPTVYYTSMYGLGLIALLVYSRRRLGETITERQQLGVGVIVLGTVLIGLLELGSGSASLYTASRSRVLLIAGIWLVAAPVVALTSGRARLAVRELLFGVAAGGLAALEALVKGVSQAGPESNTLLPQTPANWVLFVASFAGAVGAFGMIQWAFLRSCRASMMGAIYTTTYVALPLLFTPIVTRGGVPSIGAGVGVVLLTCGALLAAAPRGRRAV